MGDTIWLTTYFDTYLELTNGQSSIRLDTASGSIVITIFKIMSGQLEVAIRDNTFVVDDYNEELLNELGINGWLEETGGSGITGYIQIVDNPGAHVFKVN